MKQHTFDNSKQVKVIRYFDDTEVLEIVFVGNKTYQYYNVPETIYDGALAAESVGKYVNEHIKNKFEYKLIPF